MPVDDAGGTLRWGLGADPDSLDPRLAAGDDERVLVDALFDGLTRLDADQQPVPALATSWTTEDDATTFRFELDPDARWHDGTRVVAADVVRGLERVLDASGLPPSPLADLLEPIVGSEAAREGQALVGATAPSDGVVQLRTRRAVPELPAVLAHPGLAPVPASAEDDPTGFAREPVGNGPFRLAEPWASNQFLRLVAFADHPRPPELAEVVFRIYAGDDGDQRLDDLLAGAIGVAQVPAGRRAEVRAAVGSTAGPGTPGVHDDLEATTSLLLLDTTTPPLDDLRMRRALSLLVDRSASVAQTADERVEPDGLVPQGIAGAPVGSCRWCAFDPDTAGELIAAVLADNGGTIPPLRIVSSDDPLHAGMLGDLATRLASFGVEAEVLTPPAREYLATARDVQAGAVRLAWAPMVAGLAPWSSGLLGAGSIGRELTGFEPAAVRDLLVTASGDPRPTLRSTAEESLLRLVLDQAVVVPLLHYRDDLVVARDVAGLVRSPFGDVDLARVRLLQAEQ